MVNSRRSTESLEVVLEAVVGMKCFNHRIGSIGIVASVPYHKEKHDFVYVQYPAGKFEERVSDIIIIIEENDA